MQQITSWSVPSRRPHRGKPPSYDVSVFKGLARSTDMSRMPDGKVRRRSTSTMLGDSVHAAQRRRPRYRFTRMAVSFSVGLQAIQAEVDDYSDGAHRPTAGDARACRAWLEGSSSTVAGQNRRPSATATAARRHATRPAPTRRHAGRCCRSTERSTDRRLWRRPAPAMPLSRRIADANAVGLTRRRPPPRRSAQNRRPSPRCRTTPSAIFSASPPGAKATGRRSAASSTAARRGSRSREAEIQHYMDKRRPGQSRFTTQRREPDTVKILSGVFEDEASGQL